MKKTIVILIPIIVTVGILGITIWPNLIIQNSNFACSLTEGNPQGPYYIPGAPYKDKIGENISEQRIVISGNVFNQDCEPVANAIMDIWQTDSNGNYYFEDFVLRGKITADDDGQYKIDTIFPGKYSEAGATRPAHIHLKISAPDSSSSHTTQLYFEGDEHHDFFVKPSLILKLDDRDGVKYSNFDFVIFTP